MAEIYSDTVSLLNRHRIVIANASTAVMASGVDESLGLSNVTSVVRKEPERVFVVKRNSLDMVGTSVQLLRLSLQACYN